MWKYLPSVDTTQITKYRTPNKTLIFFQSRKFTSMIKKKKNNIKNLHQKSRYCWTFYLTWHYILLAASHSIWRPVALTNQIEKILHKIGVTAFRKQQLYYQTMAYDSSLKFEFWIDPLNRKPLYEFSIKHL